jgi:hypothetical protein
MDYPPVKPYRKREKHTCEIGICDREVDSNGMCGSHVARWNRGLRGEVFEKPIKVIRAQGSGSFSQGYVKLWDKDLKKVRAEHQIIMEQLLGRPLHPFENVHHKNGIRHDNRPDNLELWTKAQPCGQRPEDLAAWVIENYPEIVRNLLQVGV